MEEKTSKPTIEAKKKAVTGSGINQTGSDCTTDGIRVQTVSYYLPERSSPDSGQYLYGYTIRISNLSEFTVQLISRHWIIIDSEGVKSEVQGPGVVGETPVLTSGQKFQYQSFCPLPSDFGTMEGSYEFRKENGDIFHVTIARFYLAENAPIADFED